ncbi:uncharacterized protein METZ01_LOCUS279922, partial [marine metagenome]
MQFEMEPSDEFVGRHVGPSGPDVNEMLEKIDATSIEQLMGETVPASIRFQGELNLPASVSEGRLLDFARTRARENKKFRSYLGLGYHGTITPGVILRNIFENPGWYTQYTPYQAEISQGRLEALLNFQTAVIDLTGLPIANASLLDEGTAAAEAMLMLWGNKGNAEKNTFLVSESCHPQTISVIKGRAKPLEIDVQVIPHDDFDVDTHGDVAFGALVQYPSTNGAVWNYGEFCEQLHSCGAGVVVAADLLSLALLIPPGDFGADIAIGNTQRFGVPM